ncbi:MAG: hypothetical protein BWY17_00071 [Deltaproteobacteria bacterium ADurb.Bin207]|jgi:hypothetical protein|nr:MAG: hypothetical protein BWY17_00071 [Deltaproteobacteria bacterium ADurb.Bin207]
MGGMSWKYIAPFGADPARVLAEAHKDAFERRAYGKPYSRREPRARSITALRRACAEDGTCSIIDVLRVEEEPSPGVAGRMPRGLIESVCGTPRPGLAQVEDALPILYEQLHRGEAGFVVAYDGEKPVHVGFFGWSFD